MAGEWQADPSGRHQYRWHDGSQWTSTVSDNGIQTDDPMSSPSTPNTSTNLTGTLTGSASELWSGEKQSATSMATGGRVAAARYRVTEEAIHFEQGTLSTKAEMVPLWGVVDVDLQQSMTQKARGVGDVRVHLDATTATRFGQSTISIQSIKDPARVRDLILTQVQVVRRAQLELQHQREVQLRQASAAQHSVVVGQPTATVAAPQTPAGKSVVDELKQLAELRDAGILTDEEFQAQKTKLLG